MKSSTQKWNIQNLWSVFHRGVWTRFNNCHLHTACELVPSIGSDQQSTIPASPRNISKPQFPASLVIQSLNGKHPQGNILGRHCERMDLSTLCGSGTQSCLVAMKATALMAGPFLGVFPGSSTWGLYLGSFHWFCEQSLPPNPSPSSSTPTEYSVVVRRNHQTQHS